MKRIAIAAAVLAATALGSVGAAQAQVDFRVGPSGVYVGEAHHHHWDRRHWRDTTGYGGDCRVIVRTHINRWGERVTVRRRVCD